MEFNGTSASGTSLVNCGSGASLDNLPDNAVSGKGDVTIEAWIRPESFGEGGLARIIDKTNLIFHVSNTHGLRALVNCVGQSAISESGLDEFPLGNQWQYVMMTYSEAGVIGGAVARTIYLNINGVWVGSYPVQQVSIGNYAGDGVVPLIIGNDVGTTRTFGGDIGWVRISDNVRYDPVLGGDFTPPTRCALPPTDANTVLSVIYEGQGVITYDRSANGNDGTITDCTWACDCFPTEGYYDDLVIGCYPSALDFNGKYGGGTSLVNCGSAATLDDIPDFGAARGSITVDGWMRPRKNNYGELDLGRIAWKDKWSLTLAGPSGTYRGLLGFIDCAVTPALSASDLDEIIADDEWHYVLMTYSENNPGFPTQPALPAARRIYLNIDGVWVGTYQIQQDSIGNYSPDNAIDLIFGNDNIAARTFGGRLGWMRIRDDVWKTPTDGNFTPPERCVLPVADSNTMALVIHDGSGATTTDLSGNGNDGTITAAEWECYCDEMAAYTGIVREPTCEDEVYFTNKQNIAQLTNIHWYDGVVWSPNLINSALPTPLLPAVPAVGDAVYFGINTTLPDSGPFASLVFDLLQGQTDLTIAWEYWNGAWVALTVQDNTNDLANTGVNSVHWIPPAAWAPNDPGVGTTGYWVRARVSAIGANPAPPIQQNRDVYTITWPYIEVQSADIDGDIEAIMRNKLHNQTGADGGPLAAGTGRIIMGLRSISRGERFAAYINLADEQNDPGITITPDGVVNAFATLNGAPSGRYVLCGAGNGFIQIDFDSDLVTEYIGRYRVFMRHKQNLGVAGDTTAQLSIYYGDDDTYSYIGQTIPTFNTADYQVFDFGNIDFPGIELAQSDAVEATIYIATTTVGGASIQAFDLIMIPVDEWASDLQFRNTTAGATPKVDTEEYADVDGYTSPKDGFRAPSRRVTTDLITNNFSIKSGGLPILQSNARQRLWYFVQLRTSASDPNALQALPFIAHSAQIEAQQRFESVASDGT